MASVGFVRFGRRRLAHGRQGPGVAADAVHEVVCAVQEAVDAEGVTFLATDLDADGGKVIIVAGVPTSQEDDEGRLLRAARRIADARPRLPLQIGLNRGHVFAGEIGMALRSTFTVIGDTVNVAARLAAAAAAGRIYATSSILDRSRTLFVTTALEPLRVKGKTKPLRALAVGVETGSRSAGGHDELPFVGRKEELAVLRRHLDALSCGYRRRSRRRRRHGRWQDPAREREPRRSKRPRASPSEASRTGRRCRTVRCATRFGPSPESTPPQRSTWRRSFVAASPTSRPSFLSTCH